ncbi:MAG: hypothetical protein FWD17_16540 [Polyangiaceae bacterium]|nr:hypothetical protein [Polyangiaceae bacterium]
MILATPRGTNWQIDDAADKLRRRAKLPGARLFDHVADSLRRAKAAGMSAEDRLMLALPASWCVNSPAPSTVLRRWALLPDREVWVALIELFEAAGEGFDNEAEQAAMLALRALGREPFAVEAISKVAALLVPEAVPLMPPAAMAFVLGDAVPDARSFVAMVRWFVDATAQAQGELASVAAGHAEVSLVPGQVLDHLLWYDSEGFRHFQERV